MLAEERVRSASVPWVIFRPAEVFGGGGRDPILALVETVRTQTFVPILGDGSYELSPVHVDDVVAAVVRSLDVARAIGSVYTLAGAEAMSYLRLVERIERFLGLPRPRVRVRVPVALARLVVSLNAALGRAGLVRDQIPRLLLPKSADSSRAARDLGYEPVVLEKGLLRSGAVPGGGYPPAAAAS
jgi:NADH dehydrogenase